MNKGFAYYFRKAFKTAMQTICKNKNILQSMLYFFTSLAARMTLFLGAMPALADVRQAKIAQNERTIDVPQSFTNASRRPFWTMTVATILEGFIYLGGLMLVSVASGVIFSIGLAISQFVSSSSEVIIIIFSVPSLIICLVYTIIVITIFAPTAYVVDTNPELSAGEVVSVCVSSMKNRGKFTAFMCVFIPTLIIALIAGAFGVGFYFVITLLAGKDYMLLVVILLAIVTIVALGFTLPIFMMTKNIALVSLFEDIALDPVNASKRTAGINIKKISGARVDREEVADNLNALFDSAIEEKLPEEEQLVHRHKKKERNYEPEDSEIDPSQPDAQLQDEVTFEEVDDYADELPTQAEQAAYGEQAVPPIPEQPAPAQQASQPPAPPQPQPQAQAAPEQPVPPQPQAQPAPAQPVPPQPQAQPAPAQPVPPQPQPQAQQTHQAPPQPQPQAQQAQRPNAAPQGQPRPAQPYPGQPYAGQPVQGQPYPGQYAQGQPRPAQPYPGQPYAGQPVQGQPYPGQYAQGQPQRPYPGQQMPGQPYPGQAPQRPYPPQPGQPVQGQPKPGRRPVPPQQGQGNGANGNG